ncbi:Bug family tripartite tricarboxylate transporter substrate binding protein [Ramlibacter sp. Leaf400]|uniref:Bug family tripartite tricarboxylate transporter substrate binding protein n=1 Tax=Ramlibacter sp. Leaf400 TaxID=1736365 RepID=UPI0006F7A65B|nr:tripartite tricarboxylate transporter substrate binding protein [Ramlibacter sp. Leaf400]KQT14034.1 ABC transporter substrate-binding protein [Ramlibacter sp. Leaf400]
MKSFALSVSSVLLAAVLPLCVAHAQESAATFPTKPIKMVVPYPPGGSTDALARTLALKLQQRLGQSVVVENKPGAGSNLGAQFVASAPPDGYTLLLGTSAALAVNAHLYKQLAYHPLKNFAPVVLATTLPSLVVVNPSVPVRTMKELNQYLIANPDKVNYASAGNGTPAHLGAEMYKKATGAKISHVPYRGGAPALTDLIGGQTQMMIAILPEVMPFVKDGKLRALAVTTERRTALAPDLPTVAESGVPNYELTAWYAIVAPAGTPADIVAKLNKAFNSALEDTETRDKLREAGFEIAGGTPEKLGELMRSESRKWEKVVQDANVKVD